MPSCPPGTVQVGIISVHGPDGEEGCVICEDCETPQLAECWPDGTYFAEHGWAYLAREQSWTFVISSGGGECVVTDTEYEPSGSVSEGGNVYVFTSTGVIGTDSIGRTWEVTSTQTLSSGIGGACGEPASATEVIMGLKNADETFTSLPVTVGDPDVNTSGFSFVIKTWVYGVVVGYGATSTEASDNATAKIPGLS